MELADVNNHPLALQYPTRTPVWWARIGTSEKSINSVGVSGRRVVLRIEKRFNRFERILAKWFRAPKEIRRPLDSMNSMLWELCDGSRNFADICRIMDEVFNEDVSPVVSRAAMAMGLFQRNNLLLMLEEPLEGRWRIGPGQTPEQQRLDEKRMLDEFDIGHMDGEAP